MKDPMGVGSKQGAVSPITWSQADQILRYLASSQNYADITSFKRVISRQVTEVGLGSSSVR